MKYSHYLLENENAIELDERYEIAINWTRDDSKNYQQLGERFYKCGVTVFEEIINSGHDNIKTDEWFMPAIYMIRQAIELVIKSILCYQIRDRHVLQDIFLEHKHDLISLWKICFKDNITALLEDEKDWICSYLISLEKIDKNSSLFRFPFNDEFLDKYRNDFIDVVDTANSIVKAFDIVYKFKTREGEINCQCYNEVKPVFLSMSNHGIGNCSLWESAREGGFARKIEGYMDVADYLFYCCPQIDMNAKLYPIMFLVRNAVELGLKRFYSVNLTQGIICKGVKNSHELSELWKHAYPMLLFYARESDEEISVLQFANKAIRAFRLLDKNGDMFRYPCTYSFEYKLNNTNFNALRKYEYYMGLADFLDNCNWMLKSIEEYEYEKSLYEYCF